MRTLYLKTFVFLGVIITVLLPSFAAFAQCDGKTSTQCKYEECKQIHAQEYCDCKYGENGLGIGKGIPLNTDLPFIGSCIGKGDPASAFPELMGALSKILVTVIMVVGFVMVIIGGVQRAMGKTKEGKASIRKVVIGFALLGVMGAILRLINPVFFK